MTKEYTFGDPVFVGHAFSCADIYDCAGCIETDGPISASEPYNVSRPVFEITTLERKFRDYLEPANTEATKE